MKAAIAPVLEADRAPCGRRLWCEEHTGVEASVWLVSGGQAVPLCLPCVLELWVGIEAVVGPKREAA